MDTPYASVTHFLRNRSARMILTVPVLTEDVWSEMLCDSSGFGCTPGLAAVQR